MVRLPMLVAGANGQAVTNPEDGMPDPRLAAIMEPPAIALTDISLRRGNLKVDLRRR